jgi:hypothetical protein
VCVQNAKQTTNNSFTLFYNFDWRFNLQMLPPIAVTMIGIFAAILVGLFGISQFLQVKGTGNWLPSKNNLAKRQFEIYALAYSVVWIFLFGIVVAFQLWRSFTAVSI